MVTEDENGAPAAMDGLGRRQIRQRLGAPAPRPARRRLRAGALAFALASLASLASLAGLGLAPAAAQETRDVLGVTHVAGRYDFTSEDFLNEGADRLLALGTRVIKVWFTPDIASRYPFNSTWGPPPANLVELAQKPYFQALFAKPFTTYLLVFQSVSPAPQTLTGVPLATLQLEEQETHDLARYLLTTYAETGKTFILQNWEGDHLLRAGLADGEDPTRQRVLAMAAWWNAHQAGVTAARAEVGTRGVAVYHAIEVNALADAMRGKVTATNDVLPLTGADLYSYSSWDVDFDPDALTQALDYLQSKAPPSALFGRRNVYLGEYGAAKDQVPNDQQRPDVIRRLEEAALAWGVRYAVYWQLYCNEPARPFTGRPDNGDMRGFWLIRPDGTKADMWFDLGRAMRTSLSRMTLRAASGRYLTAPGLGGGPVRAESSTPGPWQWFTASRSSSQPLASGDVIYLQAHNGMYVQAEPGPSASLAAGDWEPAGAKALVIRRVSGSGPIRDGELVTLESGSGRFLAVDPRSGAVTATRAAPGPAAAFRIELQD